MQGNNKRSGTPHEVPHSKTIACHAPPRRRPAGEVAPVSPEPPLLELLKKICQNAYACHYQQNTFPGESDPCGRCANCMADEVLGKNWREAQPVSAGAEPPISAADFWPKWVSAKGWGYSLASQRIIQFAEAYADYLAAQSLPAQTVNQEMLADLRVITDEMRGEVKGIRDGALNRWADRIESAIARAESELKESEPRWRRRRND